MKKNIFYYLNKMLLFLRVARPLNFEHPGNVVLCCVMSVVGEGGLDYLGEWVINAFDELA